MAGNRYARMTAAYCAKTATGNQVRISAPRIPTGGVLCSTLARALAAAGVVPADHAARSLATPHSWHAAEVFLHLLGPAR